MIGGESDKHHLSYGGGNRPDPGEHGRLRQGVPERKEGISGDKICVVFKRYQYGLGVVGDCAEHEQR